MTEYTIAIIDSAWAVIWTGPDGLSREQKGFPSRAAAERWASEVLSY